MARWFLLLAPDYQDKIAVFDVEAPLERAFVLKEYAVPEAFIDGAAVGDFIDLDRRKGERFLVRLGREWPTD